MTASRRGNALVLVCALLAVFVIIATAFLSRTRSLRQLAASQQQSQTVSAQPERLVDGVADEIAESLFLRPVDWNAYVDPSSGAFNAALLPVRTVFVQGGNRDVIDTSRLRFASPEVGAGLWSGYGLEDRFRVDPLDVLNNLTGEVTGYVDPSAGFSWAADGFNFAPYAVNPWTNWPDNATADGEGYPQGDWNPNGARVSVANLPIGDWNPPGGPGMGDTRWLRSSEPQRVYSAQRDNPNRQPGFGWWLHLSNLGRPNNGWRICWDVSNIRYDLVDVGAAAGLQPNIQVDLDVPVEQWLANVEPGVFATLTGPAAATSWEAVWADWFDPTLHQTGYRDTASTPPNLFRLADLDGDGVRCEAGEEPADEFVPYTARWNVGRTLADADGDGWTDSFWFTVPSNLEKGMRQVAAVTVVDNGGMLDLNTATRFDPWSTRGHTPADLALGPSNDVRDDTERDQVPVAMLNSRDNRDREASGDDFLPPTLWPPIQASFNNARWAGPATLNPATPAQNETSFMRERRFIRADGTPALPFDDFLLDEFERRLSFRQSRGAPELVQLDVDGDGLNDLPELSSFGVDDEIELRGTSSSNDPTVLSRLERALGVDTTNDQLAASTSADAPSILRSTWSEEETSDYSPDRLNNPQLVRDIRRKLTVFSGATNDQRPPWDWPTPYFSTNWNYLDFQLPVGYPFAAPDSGGYPGGLSVRVAPAQDPVQARPYGLGSSRIFPADQGAANALFVPAVANSPLNGVIPNLAQIVAPSAYERLMGKVDLRSEILPAWVFELAPAVAVPMPPLNTLEYYEAAQISGEQWRIDLAHTLRRALLETPDVLDRDFTGVGANDFGAGRSYWSDLALTPTQSATWTSLQGELMYLREQTESMAASWAANAQQYRDEATQVARDAAGLPLVFIDPVEQGATVNVTGVTGWANGIYDEPRSKPGPILDSPLDPHPAALRESASATTFVRHIGLEKHPFIMQCFMAFAYPKTRVDQPLGGQNPLVAEWDKDHWRVPNGPGAQQVPGGGQYSIDQRSRGRVVFVCQVGNPYDTPISLKDFRINAWGYTFRFPDNAVLGPTTEERPCTAIVYAMPPMVWGRQPHGTGAVDEYPTAPGSSSASLSLDDGSAQGAARLDHLLALGVFDEDPASPGNPNPTQVTRFQADRGMVQYDPYFRNFWLDALDLNEVQGAAVPPVMSIGNAFPLAQEHRDDWDALTLPAALVPSIPVYEDPTTDWDHDGNPLGVAWDDATATAVGDPNFTYSGDDTLLFPAELPYTPLLGATEIPDPPGNGELGPLVEFVRSSASNTTTTIFPLDWDAPTRHPTVSIEWKVPYRSPGEPLAPGQPASAWVVVDRIDPQSTNGPPRLPSSIQGPTEATGLTFTEAVEQLREEDGDYVPPPAAKSTATWAGAAPSGASPYWYDGLRIGKEDYFVAWAHASRPWSWDVPDTAGGAIVDVDGDGFPDSNGIITPDERAPRYVIATSVQVRSPGQGTMVSEAGQSTGGKGEIYTGTGSTPAATAHGDYYNGYIDHIEAAASDPLSALNENTDDPDLPEAFPPESGAATDYDPWFYPVAWADPYHRAKEPTTGLTIDNDTEAMRRRGKPTFFTTQSLVAYDAGIDATTPQRRVYPPNFLFASTAGSGAAVPTDPSNFTVLSPWFGSVSRVAYGDLGGRFTDPAEPNPALQHPQFKLPVAWRPSVKDADFEQLGEALDVMTWGIAVETRTSSSRGVETIQRTARTFGEAVSSELDFWEVMRDRVANWFTPALNVAQTENLLRERLRYLGRLDPGWTFTPAWDATSAAPWARMTAGEPREAPLARFLETLVCDGGGMIGREELAVVNVALGGSGETDSSGTWSLPILTLNRFGNANGGNAVPGLVNVNTAPLEVLRTLPQMDRLVTDDSDVNDLQPGENWPWRTAAPATALRNGQYQDSSIVDAAINVANHYPTPDEAVHVRFPEAIIAYRDLAMDLVQGTVDLSQTDLPYYAERGNPNPVSLTLPTPIPAFRPWSRGERGFVSPAELRFINRSGNQSTLNPPAGLTGGVAYAGAIGSSMPEAASSTDSFSAEFLGRDPFRIAGRGARDVPVPLEARLSTDVTHGVVAWDPGLAPTIDLPVRDTVSGDAEELNMLFSGISNMITTRSDVFTVWMKVRTFRQNPITFRWDATDPSAIVDESRYVFCVDRSGVKKPSDRPRIVYFSKVP